MSVIKNSSIYTVGNLIPAMAGFLLLPVYSRYLSPAEYGVIASMEVVAYLYGVFVNLNLERAAYRFYFDEEAPQWRNNLFFTIHYASIIFAIFWLVIVLLFQDFITLAFPSVPFWPFFMLVFGRVAVEVVLRVPQQYFQVTERPLAFVSISIIKFFISVSFVLWFLIYREEGAQGVLTANLIGSACMLPIGFYVANRYFKGKFDKKILGEAIHFAWPFIPSLIIAWVMNLSDRVFLEYYSGQTQLGLYGMAYKIASAYFIIMGAYHAAYLPRYYKYANMAKQSMAQKVLEGDAEKNVVIHIVLSFLMILWCSDLVYFILSPEYFSIVEIMRILLISHLFAAIPAVTYTPALLQAKKTKITLYIGILVAVLNIGLNFILIPRYGMHGAALATVTSMAVMFFIQYFISRLGYVVTFPWRIFMISISLAFVTLSSFILIVEKYGALSLILKSFVTSFILYKIYFFMRLEQETRQNKHVS